MNIPSKWITILNKNEELKEMFIEQNEIDKTEPIPPYFFHYFRPDNYKLLKEFFVCFEDGIKIYENIKEIFEVTKDNYIHGDAIMAYFVPKGKGVPEEYLKEITEEYINQLNYILEENEEEKYSFNQIEIKEMTHDEFKKEFDYNNIDECDLYSLKGDWMIYELPDEEDSPLVLFYEALYNMACDYEVCHYILWPLIGSVNSVNPFSAYIKLWKLGYKPNLINDKLMILVK